MDEITRGAAKASACLIDKFVAEGDGVKFIEPGCKVITVAVSEDKLTYVVHVDRKTLEAQAEVHVPG